MDDILQELYRTIKERKTNAAPDSYTGYLFAQGLDKICKKVGEECAETIIAAKNGEPEPLIGEVSDVLYHLLVLLCECGVPWSAVRDELEVRTEKIGNKKEVKDVNRLS